MRRALAGALVGVAALVLALALWRLWPERDAIPAPAAGEADALGPTARAPAPPPAAEERRRVVLWFPAPGGKIASAEVEIASAPDPKARVETLLAALLATTPAPPLAPLFPEPVKLVATVRGPERTLYVDLAAEGGGEPPASGSQLELARVYAIVQSVVANEPSIERVVLTWNGVQRPSFAGHVDTGRPLAPRPDLVAGAEGAR